MSLDLTRAVRDSKKRIKFKVSCGHSNQQRKWVASVWVLQEVKLGNKLGWAYQPVQRVWMSEYPGADEKQRLIEDLALLFTIQLDDLGVGYVRTNLKTKEVTS